MDSIEAPSFSLGFDLDAASDPKPGLTGDDEPEPGLTVSDSDLELGPGCSSPALKRLRRGFNKCSAEDGASELLGRAEDRDDDDDDIEEFSSPEGNLRFFWFHFYLLCVIVNWLLLKLLESNLSSITSLIEVSLPFFYHSLGFMFEKL